MHAHTHAHTHTEREKDRVTERDRKRDIERDNHEGQAMHTYNPSTMTSKAGEMRDWGQPRLQNKRVSQRKQEKSELDLNIIFN